MIITAHPDKKTILKLSELGATFYVPLKLSSHLDSRGIYEVFEFDWLDCVYFGELAIYYILHQNISIEHYFILTIRCGKAVQNPITLSIPRHEWNTQSQMG